MKQSQSNKKFLVAASPLFLILFIDSMGLGLVFPLLNSIIIDSHSAFLSETLSANFRNFVFGFTIAIFMIAWFFGAAFLGDLSDQIGRKKSLLICLWGAFFGYLISAFGVSVHSYILLLLGRITAGFTAGSQAIAQASIVDLSPEQHKARNLGLIFFFMSIGFVVGPLAGGILSDAKIFAGFNYSTPFYFAALIALLNVFLLLRLFHETFKQTGKIKIKLHRAIELFISAFQNHKVRNLSIVLLIMIFGWSGFYSFISMFLLREYNFTSLEVSLYMAVLGIGFGVGTGLLVDRCVKIFSLKNCVVGGMLLTAAATLLTISGHCAAVLWIIAAPLAVAIAVAYSCIMTIFSNQVDADSQGWVMGITGSIMAFAFGLNALFVSMLADLSARLPLIITICGLVISSLLLVFFYNSGKIVEQHTTH